MEIVSVNYWEIQIPTDDMEQKISYQGCIRLDNAFKKYFYQFNDNQMQVVPDKYHL